MIFSQSVSRVTRPGRVSMSISLKPKEGMKKKNWHSILSSSSYVYVFTTGPWWGITELARVLYDYLVRLQCTYWINWQDMKNSRSPAYYSFLWYIELKKLITALEENMNFSFMWRQCSINFIIYFCEKLMA